jgi:alpha-1,2-mannosyltransferase
MAQPVTDGSTSEPSPPVTGEGAPGPLRLAALGRGVAVCMPPIVVGLWMAATTFPGGTLTPWRPHMVDLDVYRSAGTALLQGGDFYALPGPLPFIYPPFAALLAVPLTVLPSAAVEIGWTVASVLALLAMLYRLGLKGWRLSLVGTVSVYFVDPISETLGFGQPGIFLMALVVLDLVPGPAVLPRRILPPGVLTAISASVKLTPAIFVIYLIAVRRWRTALTAIVTGVVLTLGSLLVLPGPSIDFWTRLATGDTGLGQSLIYYTNQSVMADVVRILEPGRTSALIGLGSAVAVALVGVWAAMLWHRAGEIGLAVTLCGIAGVLASPVSWLHHFVWIVPLAVCLVGGDPSRRRVRLPIALVGWGWVFVGWVVAQLPITPAPLRRLPNGADLELQWTWWQHALASVTAVLGVGLLVTSVVTALWWRPTPRPSAPSGTPPDQDLERMFKKPISTADHHNA